MNLLLSLRIASLVPLIPINGLWSHNLSRFFLPSSSLFYLSSSLPLSLSPANHFYLSSFLITSQYHIVIPLSLMVSLDASLRFKTIGVCAERSVTTTRSPPASAFFLLVPSVSSLISHTIHAERTKADPYFDIDFVTLWVPRLTHHDEQARK